VFRTRPALHRHGRPASFAAPADRAGSSCHSTRHAHLRDAAPARWQLGRDRPRRSARSHAHRGRADRRSAGVRGPRVRAACATASCTCCRCGGCWWSAASRSTTSCCGRGLTIGIADELALTVLGVVTPEALLGVRAPGQPTRMLVAGRIDHRRAAADRGAGRARRRRGAVVDRRQLAAAAARQAPGAGRPRRQLRGRRRHLHAHHRADRPGRPVGDGRRRRDRRAAAAGRVLRHGADPPPQPRAGHRRRHRRAHPVRAGRVPGPDRLGGAGARGVDRRGRRGRAAPPLGRRARPAAGSAARARRPRPGPFGWRRPAGPRAVRWRPGDDRT
jgi:hypothetical protein